MTTTSQRNKKCQMHGEQGEQTALEYLTAHAHGVKVDMINGLLDMLIQDTHIEVKSCSDIIVREGEHKHRHGRFTILSQQHEELVKTDGYYLFVVFSVSDLRLDEETYHLYDPDAPQRPLIKPVKIFMVRARSMPYYHQVTWTTAQKYECSFNFRKLLVKERKMTGSLEGE